MIIYGSKGVGKVKREGNFYCSNCRTERKYALKEYKRFFTLFFIPLFPIAKLGDQLECTSCRVAYVPESILSSAEYSPAIPVRGESSSSYTVDLSSFAKRAGAYLIDYFIVVIIVVVAEQFALSNPISDFNIFTFSLVGLMYATVFEIATKGSTLGKLMLSMRTTDLQKNNLSIYKLLIRNLVKYVTGIFVLIYLVAAFRDDRRTLHDLAAGTVVVDKE